MNKKATNYQPKSILITGGAGFVGSNVLKYFVEKYENYNIVCLDKLDYCSNLKFIQPLFEKENLKFVKGNINSQDLVLHLLQSEAIDTIIHFAAQSHVDNSFGNSLNFTKNNIMGTHVLLECAKICKLKRFIYVSTDEVYGQILPNEPQLTEKSRLEPTNPYSATKTAAEFLVKAYNYSFNLPIIITRGCNVYGPNQYPEKVIPKFFCLLESNKPCTIHGNGKNTRNYIYVEDVARAFDIITHKGKIGEIYNIGSDFELSTIELAKSLIKKLGKEDNEKELISFVEDRLFNDLSYRMKSTKLKLLGWDTTIDWDEGLDLTIQWYKKNKNNWGDLKNALIAHPRNKLKENKFSIVNNSSNN
ncbi:dtdp-d-glucose 46-dehydratase [Anaeramoeba flamelloides]|uniref:Dtdp-d-glucose 46-dehydratase n=1 Tax=Anaeramoeba flamelloides TaxID=1746091 RepID=A0AAV7YHF7_9EUKA|nr:dtdp-d-glucose 46-dehydratase [Anaeramoeba flamelloides]